MPRQPEPSATPPFEPQRPYYAGWEVRYLTEAAYERGRQAGREEFAGQVLVPLLRWVLLELPCSVGDLLPEELADVEALLRGDTKRLMERAIRRAAAAAARREAEQRALAWAE